MKRSLVIIILGLVILSFTFLSRNNSGPFGSRVWDLADLNKKTIDSSTDPYSITTFDTIFAPHTQCSYQFMNGGLSGDSVIYKNYSAEPAIVKRGIDSLISNNRVVIIISGDHDTLSYSVSLPENTLNFVRVVNHLHQSETITDLYSVR
jgi:hypothetical protein